MANMIPIQTIVVGSGGINTINFTLIPQTYTDLYLVLSGRSSVVSDSDPVYIRFNGSSSNYTMKTIYGDGVNSGTANTPAGISTGIWAAAASGANTASNIFSNTSWYISNYTSSSNKIIASDGVNESSTSVSNYSAMTAGIWANSAPINQITIHLSNSSFVQHSSATLYGIRKY